MTITLDTRICKVCQLSVPSTSNPWAWLRHKTRCMANTIYGTDRAAQVMTTECCNPFIDCRLFVPSWYLFNRRRLQINVGIVL